MIVGTGGAPLYTTYAYNGVNSGWLPAPVYHENQYGYVAVEVDGPVATLTWYHKTGANSYPATAETWSYSLAPLLTSTYTNGILALIWSGGGRLQWAPEATGPWTTLSQGVSPYLQTNPPAAREFYRVKLR